jgi:hypothetical protein
MAGANVNSRRLLPSYRITRSALASRFAWKSQPFWIRDPVWDKLRIFDWSSPDDSIRSRQHIRWNCESDLFGGLKIDHQLELRWLLDRKMAALGFG